MQDWFDAQIMGTILKRDKYSKNSKNLTCMSIKIIRKEWGRNEVQKLIRANKKAYFEKKLTENIGKSKELWQSLKVLSLKFECYISNINCLENDKSANFDVKDMVKNVSPYISNLAENLVSKNPSNWYRVLSASQYYSYLRLIFWLIIRRKRIHTKGFESYC